MPTNIKVSDKVDEKTLKEAEKILQIEALRTSKRPDTKDVFKHKDKEGFFDKRYGKKVHISVTYDTYDDLNLSEYTMRFCDNKDRHYAITEYLTEQGNTDHVILSYRRNGRNIENKFDRYVDAEITLADLISED